MTVFSYEHYFQGHCWGLPTSCLSLVTALFLALLEGSFALECFFSSPFFSVATIRSVLARCCTVLFRWVGLLSRFSVRRFHVLFLGQLSPSSFLKGLSSEQFASLGSIHLLGFWVRACSLALLYLAVLFLAICRAVFTYIFLLLSGLFLCLSLFSESVGFNCSEGWFFLFFWGIFRGSCTALFFFLVVFFLALRRAALSSENACY